MSMFLGVDSGYMSDDIIAFHFTFVFFPRISEHFTQLFDYLEGVWPCKYEFELLFVTVDQSFLLITQFEHFLDS